MILAPRLVALSSLLAACGTPEVGSASAPLTTVVHDNGDPSGGFGVTILSELDTFNQVGDDFSLAGEVRLEAVEWWGDGDGNDFRLRIFEIIAGVPQTAPLHDVDLGEVTGAPQIFDVEHLFYSAPLPDIELAPGDYLLSIVDQTPAQTWFWSASCEDGCEDESFRRPVDGAPWEIGNWNFAFRLLGTGAPGKLELCHCPKGRPDNCHTIEVSEKAAAAHLEHHADDALGACD